jgi:hypothetical protein
MQRMRDIYKTVGITLFVFVLLTGAYFLVKYRREQNRASLLATYRIYKPIRPKDSVFNKVTGLGYFAPTIRKEEDLVLVSFGDSIKRSLYVEHSPAPPLDSVIQYGAFLSKKRNNDTITVMVVSDNDTLLYYYKIKPIYIEIPE